jgi:hypothetical protein
VIAPLQQLAEVFFMESNVIGVSTRHPVVFGVYRDGDNNLDEAQERNVTDFVKTTARDPALKVIAEDTTAQARPPFHAGDLRTESSIIQGGSQHVVRVEPAVDMSSRSALASFVERTLAAKAGDPTFARAPVWIDLVDHGGGDGGGLQSDTTGGFMSVEDIGGAIADGRARFRKSHPGGDDVVAGVVANQCLMASLGFADALSRAGVKYLCASPETMLTPGVPSAKVAQALTDAGDNWPQVVVDSTMRARYGPSDDTYHPAAAFDVLDLDPTKMAAVRDAVGAFNAAVAALPHHGETLDALHEIRADLSSVKGMVRFDHASDMPWHADRPAIAAYDRIAGDERLPDEIRSAAQHASAAVGDLVLAHRESAEFGPFHASYRDAAGPTEHLPTKKNAYDSWAEQGVSETHTDFFDATGGRELARAIGAYNQREDAAGNVADAWRDQQHGSAELASEPFGPRLIHDVI